MNQYLRLHALFKHVAYAKYVLSKTACKNFYKNFAREILVPSAVALATSTFRTSAHLRKALSCGARNPQRQSVTMQTHPFRFVPTFRGDEISRFRHLRIRLVLLFDTTTKFTFIKCQHLL